MYSLRAHDKGINERAGPRTGEVKMFIGSFGDKVKIIGYAGIEKCRRCKNHGDFSLAEVSLQVKVYFVKVAKFKSRHFVFCEICEDAWELPENEVAAAIKMTIALPSREECHAIWNAFSATVGDAQKQNMSKDDIGQMVVQKRGQLKTTYLPVNVDYVLTRYLAYCDDEDLPS